uniref:Uncharacterized protein n=1 Tax=Spongospora subterranea TaxID=70186 RepID=A0A0H5QKY4_9EUKA|eukprot:CRZ02006.1 hypothetical protein [Spongospora subterranea]
MTWIIIFSPAELTIGVIVRRSLLRFTPRPSLFTDTYDREEVVRYCNADSSMFQMLQSSTSFSISRISCNRFFNQNRIRRAMLSASPMTSNRMPFKIILKPPIRSCEFQQPRLDCCIDIVIEIL